MATESERPAQGVLPFLCDRLSVPNKGADFPLLAWVPETWRKALEDPDCHLMDSDPKGPYPRMYLRVAPGEWRKYLRRLGEAAMMVGLPKRRSRGDRTERICRLELFRFRRMLFLTGRSWTGGGRIGARKSGLLRASPTG